MVVEMEEKVRKTQANLKEAQSRQKSYADKRGQPLAFEVGNYVYMKVSPMKGVHRFGVKGKLAPRYIGPYRISEQHGPVAYRLELPILLSMIHDVFHVSQLKKCVRVPEEIIKDPDLEIKSDLTNEEKLVKILDQKTCDVRTKSITFYKVQWNQYTEEEATWEHEEFRKTMKTMYPEKLFEMQ
jgi:hypothetical protein